MFEIGQEVRCIKGTCENGLFIIQDIIEKKVTGIEKYSAYTIYELRNKVTKNILYYRIFDNEKASDYFSLNKIATVNDLAYKETILKRMNERLDKQTVKGIEKYDDVLSNYTGMEIEERLNHLSEELIDGLVYIEHILAAKEEIKKIVKGY